MFSKPEGKETIENRFVLGIDLDGVVADFYAGLRPIAAEWLDVPEDLLPAEVSYGLEEWGIDRAPGGYLSLHRFAVKRQLFQKLRPIAGAASSLRRLSGMGIRIRIITHRLVIRYFHETVVRQTIEWLDTYDVPYWDLCFMKDKAAVGADLYIDDSPLNVGALRCAGCDVLVFTNSTNRAMAPPRAASWAAVEEYVVSALNRWRENGRGKKEPAGH